MAHRDTYHSYLKLNSDLDSNFGSMMYEIEQRIHILDRNHKVLVTLWMRKLSAAQTSNTTFKKNRNAYARLLLEMLGRSRIEDPFDKRPPEGPLPQMPSWLVASLCSPGRNRRSASPGPRDALDPMKLNQTRALFQQRDAVYDAYQGRIGPRVNLGPSGGRSASSARGRRPLDFGRTRTQLEAELGASREHARELEFRVGQAEGRALDTHVAYARELADRSARRVVTDVLAASGKGTKSKLDEIIDRYERKKDQWELPASAGGTRLSTVRVPETDTSDPFSASQNQLLADLDSEISKAMGGQPREEIGVLSEDENAWMKSLEEFKRTTSLLKQQIASISSQGC